MSNTREKLFFGLLALFGLVSLVFLAMRNSSTLTSILSRKKARPERNNNPFALLQSNPSNWVGLAGKDYDGLLIFDTPVNGVRAGFVNLYKRYLRQGLNTITKIAPVYTGLLDWRPYAQNLSKVSGIGINDLINESNVKRLARGIERMEAGYTWVSTNDFDTGFKMASDYVGHGNSGGGATGSW